jgi:hypothetical protein
MSSSPKLPPKVYTEADLHEDEVLVPVYLAIGRGKSRVLTVHCHTIVSKEKFLLFEAHRLDWRPKWSPGTRSYYIVRYVCRDDKVTAYYLHREILGLTQGDGLIADHRDGDTQNNSLRNLRPTDCQGNAANHRKHRSGKSPYKGVYTHTDFRTHPHKAYIQSPTGQQLYLGHYFTAAQAALAYDLAATIIRNQYPDMIRPLNLHSQELKRDHPEELAALKDVLNDRPTAEAILRKVKLRLRERGVPT